MKEFINNKTYKKIERYLYDYTILDDKIDSLKSSIKNADYNQSYSRFIKNRSSSLEDLVIRNIESEKKIEKIGKWKDLITSVLENYKLNNELYYNYIVLKYIKIVGAKVIQKNLKLSFQQQKDIKADIMHYIFFLAVKNNLLKGGKEQNGNERR